MPINDQERPPLSDAQFEIMHAVWKQGQATVASVWKDLSALRPIARNTVQTMMKRLEDKGWLRHEAMGNTFVYVATVNRTKALRGAVQSLVEAAFAGSAEGLVMALLDGRGVSPREARRIRAMIEKSKTKG